MKEVHSFGVDFQSNGVHFTKASDEFMADLPAVQSYIDVRLRVLQEAMLIDYINSLGWRRFFSPTYWRVYFANPKLVSSDNGA